MAQSTKIIVFMIFAYVIYTTMRGHLVNYLKVLGLAN